jgi:hypothetical protein
VCDPDKILLRFGHETRAGNGLPSRLQDLQTSGQTDICQVQELGTRDQIILAGLSQDGDGWRCASARLRGNGSHRLTEELFLFKCLELSTTPLCASIVFWPRQISATRTFYGTYVVQTYLNLLLDSSSLRSLGRSLYHKQHDLSYASSLRGNGLALPLWRSGTTTPSPCYLTIRGKPMSTFIVYFLSLIKNFCPSRVAMKINLPTFPSLINFLKVFLEDSRQA